METAYKTGSLHDDEPLKQNHLITPKRFPDRPLILLKEGPTSNDPALLILTSIQPRLLNRILVESLCRTLNDKAFEIYNILASQHCSNGKLLFPTAQSATFNSKKHFRHAANTNSEPVYYAQVTSSAKVHENNSASELAIAHSTESRKTFDLIKQIEELFESYRATNSDLSDIEFLKKVLHAYHDAYFSSTKLQLILETKH